jgi:hypothetical protein
MAQHGPPWDLLHPSRRSNTVWYRRRAESPIQHGKSTGRAALSGLECSGDNVWQLRRLKGEVWHGNERRSPTWEDHLRSTIVDRCSYIHIIIFILYYYSSCIPAYLVWRIPRRIISWRTQQASTIGERRSSPESSLPTDPMLLCFRVR